MRASRYDTVWGRQNKRTLPWARWHARPLIEYSTNNEGLEHTGRLIDDGSNSLTSNQVQHLVHTTARDAHPPLFWTTYGLRRDSQQATNKGPTELGALQLPASNGRSIHSALAPFCSKQQSAEPAPHLHHHGASRRPALVPQRRSAVLG